MRGRRLTSKILLTWGECKKWLVKIISFRKATGIIEGFNVSRCENLVLGLFRSQLPPDFTWAAARARWLMHLHHSRPFQSFLVAQIPLPLRRRVQAVSLAQQR